MNSRYLISFDFFVCHWNNFYSMSAHCPLSSELSVVYFRVKQDVCRRWIKIRRPIQLCYICVIASIPLWCAIRFIEDIADVVTVTLGAIVMHYTVQFVGSLRGLLLAAGNRQNRLYFNNIIYFREVHVPFTEYKPLQVYDKYLGQWTYLRLLRHLSSLAAIFTR